MSEQAQILLMTQDASLAPSVAAAIAPQGHTLIKPTAHDHRELLGQLVRLSPPVVLADLDPDPRRTLLELERIITRFPSARFIALSSSLQNELLLEAMQAGLRCVIAKQRMSSELQPSLARLFSSGVAHDTAANDLVTVLSAGGGCGATTLAVNLAREIALQRQQPSLLIDLDSSYGAIAVYLGLDPRYALDNILNYNGPIDASLIRSTATQHNDTLHVLASPASVQFSDPAPLKFDRFEQAIHCARRAYHSTVVDAPRIPMDLAATLVNASTSILLVFQLTVKDIRVAREMLGALTSRGVSLKNVLPVANRYAKRQAIGLDEAGKAIGGLNVEPVRNDYDTAINALNFGQTLEQAAPRSIIRRDLQNLLPRIFRDKNDRPRT